MSTGSLNIYEIKRTQRHLLTAIENIQFGAPISFEVAAIFHPPYRWVKKRGKFKTNFIFALYSPLKVLHNRNILVIFVERGSKYQIFPGFFTSKNEKLVFYNFNKYLNLKLINISFPSNWKVIVNWVINY